MKDLIQYCNNIVKNVNCIVVCTDFLPVITGPKESL